MRSLDLILVALSALGCFQTAQARTCGNLAAVKDKVEILRLQPSQTGGDAEAVRYAIIGKSLMSVECDDVVQTNSSGSAKLTLGDDKITLAPDSRIEIAKYSGSEAKPKVDLLNLTYGKMRGLIKKRAVVPSSDKKVPQGAFRVRTFSAVVGVRGTDLFASYDPNAGVTEQAVIEGQVEVIQAGTNRRVLVGSGQQVTVETTPAAIEEARKRAQGQDQSAQDSAADSLDVTPPPAAETAQAKPLKVVPIQESLRKDMRIASAIAKEDTSFATPKAISVLGQPKTWTIEREETPANLKDIKNEF